MTNIALMTLGTIVVLLYFLQMSIANWYTKKYDVKIQDWIFNLNLNYSPENVYQSLAKLPTALRTAYIKLDVLDSIFTILCGIFLTILSLKAINTVTDNTIFKLLGFFFILSTISNLIENILLVTVFSLYPKKLPKLAALASILTKAKFLFIILGSIVLITFIILLLINLIMAS